MPDSPESLVGAGALSAQPIKQRRCSDAPTAARQCSTGPLDAMEVHLDGDRLGGRGTRLQCYARAPEHHLCPLL